MNFPIVSNAILDRFDYTETANHLYNRLTWEAKLQYPTIWSAFKAGLVGNFFPVAPFFIEVATEDNELLVVRIDPADQENWVRSVNAQVAGHAGVPGAVVSGADGKTLQELGLERVWGDRWSGVTYHASYIRDAQEARIEAKRDKKRVTKPSGDMKEYLHVMILTVENMLSNYVSNTLTDTPVEQRVMVLRTIAEPGNALVLATRIVEKCTHVEDGRSMDAVLLECGFTDSAFFIEKLARRITQTVNSLILEIEGTRGTSVELIVRHFCTCVRKCRIARWLTGMWARRQAHIARINVHTNTVRYHRDVEYVSSSDSEGSSPSSMEEGEDPYDDSERFKKFILVSEPIGAGIRLSNVVRTGSVSLRILRRDDFVALAKRGATPSKRDYVSFSKLGSTGAEPGDIVRVRVRRASRNPVTPQGGPLRRARGFFRKSVTKIAEVGTGKVSQGPVPDQFVRVDVVRYDRSPEEKAKGVWTVVSTVRHKREEEDYMGYAFVVPASSLARFAFHIYENTLGSDNQWVYRGIRVLDPPRGGSSKSKRTVRYVPAALDAYMATANPSPDLSSGRYVGYAPFPRRLSAGGPVFSSFPPIVGEPDARRGVPPPPCLEAAWDAYGVTDPESGYWERFARTVAYPKAKQVANLIYGAARERNPPFPDAVVGASPQAYAEYRDPPVVTAQECAPAPGTGTGAGAPPPASGAPEDELAYQSGPESESESDESDSETSSGSDSDVVSAGTGGDDANFDENGWSKVQYVLAADHHDPSNPAKAHWLKGEAVYVSKQRDDPGFAFVTDVQGQYVTKVPTSILPPTQDWAALLVGDRYSPYTRHDVHTRAINDNRFTYPAFSPEAIEKLATIECAICGRKKNAEIGCPVCNHQRKKKQQADISCHVSSSSLDEDKKKKKKKGKKGSSDKKKKSKKSKKTPSSSSSSSSSSEDESKGAFDAWASGISSARTIDCQLCGKKHQEDIGCPFCGLMGKRSSKIAKPAPSSLGAMLDTEEAAAPISLNRNAITENRVPLLELHDTAVFVYRGRGGKDDEAIGSLARDLRVVHCMANGRDVIYRRTLLGLDRGCRVPSELASGVLHPVWPARLLSDNTTPVAAYDENALYFFRLPMDTIDMKDIAGYVLDEPDAFISALLFIVTRGAADADALLDAARVRCTAPPAPLARDVPVPMPTTCEEAVRLRWRNMIKIREGEWAHMAPYMTAKPHRRDPTDVLDKMPSRGVAAATADDDRTPQPAASSALASMLQVNEEDEEESVDAGAEDPVATAIGNHMPLHRSSNRTFMHLWDLTSPSLGDGALFQKGGNVYVVIVPEKNIFSRIYDLIYAKKLRFRDFLRSHTILLPATFMTHSREYTVPTLDGSRQVQIKYEFRKAHRRGFLRIASEWRPIDSLETGATGVRVYAVSHPKDL